MATSAYRLLRILGFLILAVLLVSQLQAQNSDPFTTIILVRHAEKDSVGVNPSLTKRGMERAEALARTLAAMDVSTIYITQYLRTQQTAKPLATLRNLQPLEFDVDLSKPRQYAKALVDEIMKKHPGETVLVSNHSNLIPLIIDALGAEKIGDIADRIYDHLYIVVRHSSGKTKLLKLRYGAPSE